MMPSAVKKYAVEHGLEVLQPPNLREEEFLETLRNMGADLFVVVAFRMLPEVVWKMPALGTINLHGSLLPQYRGAAPIHRAVMNGETVTGVTTFFIRQEIDTGAVIMQRSMDIGPDETTGEVHDRMMKMGAQVLVETVRLIEAGEAKAIEQDILPADGGLKPAPKLFRDDCRISFNAGAHQVHNFIRGLSPFPGAWFTADGKLFKVYRSKVAQTTSPSPGVIDSDGKTFLRIGCTEGCIELIEIQPEGKKRMDIMEFLRGVQQLPASVDK
jgi:methionyl-tRNA formyltransferase